MGFYRASVFTWPLASVGVDPDSGSFAELLDGTAGVTADCTSTGDPFDRCRAGVFVGLADTADLADKLAAAKRPVAVAGNRIVFSDNAKPEAFAAETSKVAVSPMLREFVDVHRAGRFYAALGALFAAFEGSSYGSEKAAATRNSTPEAEAIRAKIREIEAARWQARAAHFSPLREALGDFARNGGDIELAVIAKPDHVAFTGGIAVGYGGFGGMANEVKRLRAQQAQAEASWDAKRATFQKQIDALYKELDALTK